ncbi:MAG: CBS domain-containing protein [Phycisphaerae bacterium]|nr:CBS domain-containing protein [Phycisphaerae bacterium]
MSTLSHILAGKPHIVHSIAPAESILVATQRMNRHKIGALLVMESGHIVGILTERDILQRVVAADKNPHRTTVGEAMTRDVIFCDPDTSLQEASTIMKAHRVRHLPVCDQDGQLLGMVSIGDLNAQHASEQEITIHYLHEYVYGRV